MGYFGSWDPYATVSDQIDAAQGYASSAYDSLYGYTPFGQAQAAYEIGTQISDPENYPSSESVLEWIDDQTSRPFEWADDVVERGVGSIQTITDRASEEADRIVGDVVDNAKSELAKMLFLVGGTVLAAYLVARLV